MTTSLSQPETITRLLDVVYPAFALLAGMELDVWTQLKDDPQTAEQLAEKLDVPVGKLKPLLYALVVAGLLVVEGDRFSNKYGRSRSLPGARTARIPWRAVGTYGK